MYLAADTPQDVVAGVKVPGGRARSAQNSGADRCRVQYALDNGLKASFRGQGHHEAGVAFLPGGLTIDMSEQPTVLPYAPFAFAAVPARV